MQDRIDKILVSLGLVESRTKASDLIKAQKISYRGKLVQRTSFKVSSDSLLSDFEMKLENQYVGRGAHKVAGAVSRFSIQLKDQIIADVGASTGGFTDYVLQSGAQKVYAIDVGHDQLAMALRKDERVVNLEGTNIRHGIPELYLKVDLAVVDLSFISLKLVLKPIFDLVKEEGHILALVKPQFEVGKEGLSKNGLVRELNKRIAVLKNLYDWCFDNGFFIKNFMRSVIEGKKSGNIEYFFYFEKKLEAHLVTWDEIIAYVQKYEEDVEEKNL